MQGGSEYDYVEELAGSSPNQYEKMKMVLITFNLL